MDILNNIPLDLPTDMVKLLFTYFLLKLHKDKNFRLLKKIHGDKLLWQMSLCDFPRVFFCSNNALFQYDIGREEHLCQTSFELDYKSFNSFKKIIRYVTDFGSDKMRMSIHKNFVRVTAMNREQAYYFVGKFGRELEVETSKTKYLLDKKMNNEIFYFEPKLIKKCMGNFECTNNAAQNNEKYLCETRPF